MKTIHSKLRSRYFFYEVWLSIGNGHQMMTFEEDSVSNKRERDVMASGMSN